MPDGSESLGGVGVGDASSGGGGDAADVFSDGVRDIRLKKKAGSGTHDWCMLLPLNPQAIFYKAPRKLTKATATNFNCCYR
jgi:hypothetical protein